MEAYLAGHRWSPGFKARCAVVVVLGAGGGAFVFLCCAVAAMFEPDPASRPTGSATDSTFVTPLGIGALLAVTIPLLVGRLTLGQHGR